MSAYVAFVKRSVRTSVPAPKNEQWTNVVLEPHIFAQICLFTKYVNLSVFGLFAKFPKLQFKEIPCEFFIFCIYLRNSKKGQKCFKTSSINHIQRFASRSAVRYNQKNSITPPLVESSSLRSSPPPSVVTLLPPPPHTYPSPHPSPTPIPVFPLPPSPIPRWHRDQHHLRTRNHLHQPSAGTN